MKRLSNNTVAFIVCTVIICYVIALIRLDAINIIVEPLNGIFMNSLSVEKCKISKKFKLM